MSPSTKTSKNVKIDISKIMKSDKNPSNDEDNSDIEEMKIDTKKPKTKKNKNKNKVNDSDESGISDDSDNDVEENDEVEEEPEEDQDDNLEEKEEEEEEQEELEEEEEEEGDDDETDHKPTKTKKKTSEQCYVKHARFSKDDDIEFEIEDDIEIDKKDRICKPILTWYEYVRLLSVRSEQIARGAKPMVKHNFGNDYRNFAKDIAKLEIKNKTIPLIIERPIPNSVSEKWYITELEIPFMENI